MEKTKRLLQWNIQEVSQQIHDARMRLFGQVQCEMVQNFKVKPDYCENDAIAIQMIVADLKAINDRLDSITL